MGLLLPVKLTTRATIEPSPDNGCQTKLNSSALVNMPCPDPFIVNALFAYVALPAIPTEPTSPSDQPDGSGVTVNEALLAGAPLTVTENDPEDAPAGTVAAMEVAAQLTTVAAVPLSETVLPPCVPPKLEPEMVTSVPTGPEVGDRLVMDGACAETLPEQTDRNKTPTNKAGRQLVKRINTTSEHLRESIGGWPCLQGSRIHFTQLV
jgi:hypothetical protein